MPSRLPAWSGSSKSCLKLPSDQISSSISPSSGIHGKPPDGAYDPAPKGVPAGGTVKSSSGSLAGPDPAGELRGASAGSTPEVIKAGTPKEVPVGGTSKSSSGSLAGPDPAEELRGASAGSTPEVIKAETPEEGPVAGAESISSPDDKVPEGTSPSLGRLPLSATGDSRGGVDRPGASPGSEVRKSPKSSSASNTSYPRLSIKIKPIKFTKKLFCTIIDDDGGCASRF